MLGINDLKSYFAVSAAEIARGAGMLVGIIQNSSAGADKAAPKVLLICPPPVSTLLYFAKLFAGASEKSYQLADYYRAQADAFRCEFLDAGQIITSSDRDGIHLEASQHQSLGIAVAERVRHALA